MPRGTPMNRSALLHLEDERAPVDEWNKLEAAAEIRRLQARVMTLLSDRPPAPGVSVIEWIAALFGVMGAALLAAPVAPAWGFGAFLVSNGFWIAFGKRRRLWSVLAQQVAFTVTSIAGLWNWWLGPLLLG